MKNQPILAPVEEALQIRFMKHLENNVENKIPCKQKYDERLNELYIKLEASLSKKQWALFMEFDDTCAEYDSHRLEIFYRTGFADGFASGMVIAHD